MKTIRFSHNWNNKLDCNVFTTIRKYTDEKFEYYSDAVGKPFKVLLKKAVVCEAELHSVVCMNSCNLDASLLMTDTGLEPPEARELLRRFGVGDEDKVLILIFKKKQEVSD